MSEVLESLKSTQGASLTSMQDLRPDLPMDAEERRRRMANVDYLLGVFLGYHQPERPRPGAQVRDRNGHTSTILGVTVSGHALLACNSCDTITVDVCDRLQENNRYPRRPVSYIFARALQLFMKSGCRDHRVLPVLIGHLSGANGASYRDPVALAHGVVVAMRLAGFDPYARIKGFADEIVAEVTAEGLDLADLPMPILRLSDEDSMETTLADLAGSEDHPSDDQLIDEFIAICTTYLEDLERKVEEANKPREVPPLSTGFDILSGRDVVVLGPSLMEQGTNWFDVLSLGEAQLDPIHLGDIELDDRSLEPNDPDLLGALHELAMAEDGEAMWYLLNTPLLQAPDAIAPRLLLAACAFRATLATTPAIARRAHKQMYAIAKDLPKSLKSQMVARVPELVNPRARKDVVALGTAAQLMEPLKEALWTLDWPIRPEFVEAERRHGEGAASEVVAAPEARGATAAETPAAPTRAERRSKPLSSPVTEHSVLSTEWVLPSTPDAADVAITTTLAWLSERMGASLPSEWATGWHEIEIGSVRLQVEAAGELFAIRLEHPDSQHPTRTWRLEATVVRGAPGMVGLRLTARDRTPLPQPFNSVPGIVGAWTSAPGLMLGDRLAGEPLRLSNHQDFFTTRALLEDGAREFSVWVLPPGSTVEPPLAIRSMVQVVHVSAGQLANYEKKLGAIPPAGLQHFAAGSSKAEVIADAADNRAMSGLKRGAIAARRRPDTPTFRDVCSAIREAAGRRAEAGQGAGTRTSPDHQADALIRGDAPATAGDLQVRHERSDEQLLLELALADRQSLVRELEQVRADNHALRAKLHALQVAEDASTPDTALDAGSSKIPGDLAGLGRWATSIAPRVRIADKALRHAMRTEHNEVPKIYATLQALADHYWPMRWGNDEQARRRWLDFLHENRMRCGPIGLAAESQMYEAAYQAAFDGKMVGMTMHVQGSSSRDPLRCIRIYFHADDATREIRVGHLPTHLTNTLT